MIFKIGDQYFHPEEIPCCIIFNDDAERIRIAEVITSIVPLDKENENPLHNTRVFSAHNPKHFETREAWEDWSMPPIEELEKAINFSEAPLIDKL